MSLPEMFRGSLSVPVIAAPMFLVSGPELVIACCRNGVAGTLPALNARPASQLDEWFEQINAARSGAERFAPWGVNLILHASNERLKDDLAAVVRHRAPFVITSLGHPGAVVEAVHGYGGLVFSDVIHPDHARKAIEASAALQIVLQQIAEGRFSPGQTDRYHGLVHRVWHHDYFLVASDFDAYDAAQQKVDAAFADPDGWAKMAAMNTARSGFFSSDRTIRAYMKDIWDIPSAL